MPQQPPRRNGMVVNASVRRATPRVSSGRRQGVSGRLREVRRYWYAYLFISPFFVLFAVFGLYPYANAFVLSFLEWDGIGERTWVGLANYSTLLQDEIWWRSLYNSFWLLVVTTLNLPLALVLAFVLNSRLVRLRELFRIAYFMPVVASSVAVSIVFVTLFGERYGLLNYVLSLVGQGGVAWLEDSLWIKPAIALVVIWRWFGWNVIIYLAGLQSIPEELYEAARIDGASTFQVFRYVTVPLLKPVITFTVVLSIIGGLQLFDEPLLLAGGTGTTSPGGTDRAGLTVLVYLYSMGFHYLKFGYAAALSVALFVVIAVFSFLYYRLVGSRED